MRILLILLAVCFVISCNGHPADWAETLASKVKCNMTLKDVQQLTNRDVQSMEVPKDWVTHFIRDNGTDLWFGFDNDKLKFVQIVWAEKMMKVAKYQRVSLCPE